MQILPQTITNAIEALSDLPGVQNDSFYHCSKTNLISIRKLQTPLEVSKRISTNARPVFTFAMQKMKNVASVRTQAGIKAFSVSSKHHSIW